MFKWFHSITRDWKRGRTVALSFVAALVGAGLLMGLYDKQVYENEKIQAVLAQGRILASSVTAALVFQDDGSAQEYLNALQVNPDFEAAGVYNTEGRLVASYTREDFLPLPATVQIQEPYFERDQLIVTLPVMQTREQIGTVYMRVATEPLSRRLPRYIGIVLLVTMAAVVVAVLATAHAALTRANAELESRALELAETNQLLQTQIKEREKAEDALRQSQKMEAVGQLSGGIAHDFNNLLTAVRGSLQLLQKRLNEGQTDVKRYIDAAMDGLIRASNLTQRILAFSRRQALQPKLVNLSVLVDGMNELLRHSVGNQVTLALKLQSGLWPIFCDVNQMESSVLNMAINARDAMRDGGRLTIETANVHFDAAPDLFEGAPPGDYVKLIIADTGTGMSPEVREKAFEPFFTTKPQGQGTGLGLSMVYGYIKQSHGFLRIDSEVGKGTMISILMPRHHGEMDRAAASTTAPAPESVGPVANEPSVLVVEDEFIVRMVAREALRDEGYNVLEAADGNEAMSIIDSGVKLDMIVTDVKLPGVDGYQLAEAALKMRPGVSILMMTGYTKEPLPANMAEAGVNVIYKPFSIESFAAHVKRLLKV